MSKDSGRLPTKTKIAVWWIAAVGVISTISLIVFLLAIAPSVDIDALGAFVFALFVIPVLYIFYNILLDVFLCLKRGWAWILAVIMLSIEFLIFFFWLAFTDPLIAFYSVVYLVPLILIGIDFKNYWAMVEYRTAMKKSRTPLD